MDVRDVKNLELDMGKLVILLFKHVIHESFLQRLHLADLYQAYVIALVAFIILKNMIVHVGVGFNQISLDEPTIKVL